jgi:hypothetical protein
MDLGVDSRRVWIAMSQMVTHFFEGQPRVDQMPGARMAQAVGTTTSANLSIRQTRRPRRASPVNSSGPSGRTAVSSIANSSRLRRFSLAADVDRLTIIALRRIRLARKPHERRVR